MLVAFEVKVPKSGKITLVKVRLCNSAITCIWLMQLHIEVAKAVEIQLAKAINMPSKAFSLGGLGAKAHMSSHDNFEN